MEPWRVRVASAESRAVNLNGHSCACSPTHLLTEASIVLHDTVVHVSSVSQLEDEVELGGRVDDLVQAHHVGVLNHLHASHLLEKVTPCHWVQLSLINYFYCDLESRTQGKTVIVIFPILDSPAEILDCYADDDLTFIRKKIH